jgi:hypothetical protein
VPLAGVEGGHQADDKSVGENREYHQQYQANISQFRFESASGLRCSSLYDSMSQPIRFKLRTLSPDYHSTHQMVVSLGTDAPRVRAYMRDSGGG